MLLVGSMGLAACGEARPDSTDPMDRLARAVGVLDATSRYEIRTFTASHMEFSQLGVDVTTEMDDDHPVSVVEVAEGNSHATVDLSAMFPVGRSGDRLRDLVRSAPDGDRHLPDALDELEQTSSSSPVTLTGKALWSDLMEAQGGDVEEAARSAAAGIALNLAVDATVLADIYADLYRSSSADVTLVFAPDGARSEFRLRDDLTLPHPPAAEEDRTDEWMAFLRTVAG